MTHHDRDGSGGRQGRLTRRGLLACAPWAGPEQSGRCSPRAAAGRLLGLTGRRLRALARTSEAGLLGPGRLVCVRERNRDLGASGRRSFQGGTGRFLSAWDGGRLPALLVAWPTENECPPRGRKPILNGAPQPRPEAHGRARVRSASPASLPKPSAASFPRADMPGRPCVDAPSDARGFSRSWCAGSGASVCPACLVRPFTRRWPVWSSRTGSRTLLRARGARTFAGFPDPVLPTVAPYLSSDLPAP
jgi:hypothetical protein